MSDQSEMREDPTESGSAPATTSTKGLSTEGMSTAGLAPGVWVTGLIAAVLLLLAAFALG